MNIADYFKERGKRQLAAQKEEDERISMKESKERIRIEDYGDEVCLTINGIKAMTITDVNDGINKLKELREEYVRKQITKS